MVLTVHCLMCGLVYGKVIEPNMEDSILRTSFDFNEDRGLCYEGSQVNKQLYI